MMKRIISVFLCSALTLGLLSAPAFALKGVVINPEEARYITPEEMQALEAQAAEGNPPADLEGISFGESVKVDIPTEESELEPEPEPEVNGQPSGWAQAEIEAAIARGLVPVFTDVPSYQDAITREQFAELVFCTVRSIIDGNFPHPPFDDTDNPRVLQAAGMGIVNGVGNNLFAPKETTNREQIATMLYRAWDLVRVAGPSEGLEGYTDSGEVSDWAVDAVGAMTAAGIMKGTSDTTLSPKDPCTVEQAILLCYRFYQNY